MIAVASTAVPDHLTQTVQLSPRPACLTVKPPDGRCENSDRQVEDEPRRAISRHCWDGHRVLQSRTVCGVQAQLWRGLGGAPVMQLVQLQLRHPRCLGAVNIPECEHIPQCMQLPTHRTSVCLSLRRALRLSWVWRSSWSWSSYAMGEKAVSDCSAWYRHVHAQSLPRPPAIPDHAAIP